jgi:hypothetical protein
MLAKQQQRADRQQHELDEEERISKMIERQIEAARLAGSSEDCVEAEGVAPSTHDREIEINPAVKVEIKLAVGAKKRGLNFSAFGEEDDDQDGQGHEPKKPKANSTADAVDFAQATSSSSSLLSSAFNKAGMTSSKQLSNIQQHVKDEQARKVSQLLAEDKKNRKDNWLHAGIVVRVMNKTLAGGKSS